MQTKTLKPKTTPCKIAHTINKVVEIHVKTMDETINSGHIVSKCQKDLFNALTLKLNSHLDECEICSDFITGK